MEPDHRFIWYLCSRIFKCLPDDPRIENIDPVQKLYMFHHWNEDKKEQFELAKNLAYIIGSFINPEMVRKLTGEGIQEFKADNEEFDEFSKQLIIKNRQEDTKKRRKKKVKPD